MVSQSLGSSPKTDLRERAEAVVAGGAPDLPCGAADPQQLMHALQAQQAALRLQNQALLEVLHQAGVYKTKYEDLYESAPVAYLGVRQDGKISKLNQCGVALLGGAQGGAADLIGKPITDFTTPESSARLQALLAQAFKACGEVSSEQIELRSTRVLPVFVNARAKAYRPADSTALEVRLVLTDITALCIAKDDVIRHMMNCGD